jgi:hypothetical protein
MTADQQMPGTVNPCPGFAPIVITKQGDQVMSKVLVVYCSMSGNTKAAGEAIAEGARTAGAGK